MLLLMKFYIALMLAILAPTQATPTAEAPPAPNGPALLGGPSVAPRPPALPTIVERNFDGSLAPLEDEPEIVAVYRLELEPAQREALDQVAAKRSKAFGDLVSLHYDAIIQVGVDLRRMRELPPDERRAALGRMRAVTEAMQPFVARGSFIDEAKDVLTTEQATAARAIAAQWRTARMEDARRGGAAETPPGEAPTEHASDDRLRQRLALEDFGAMVRRTIERRADFAKAQFAELVRALDLTPEQAETFRALFMERAIQEIQGKSPGPLSMQERREIFGKLAKILDERQRALLRERILDARDHAPAR